MLPKWHILIGFVVSYLLVYYFNFSLVVGLIIFSSSFIIDIDHYFYYAIYKKDWNPFNAIEWFYELVEKHKKLTITEKKMIKNHILIFHGIEFWMIIFILGIYLNKVFLFILTGIGIHMLADWAQLIYSHRPISLKFSQILVFIKNKNKKELE